MEDYMRGNRAIDYGYMKSPEDKKKWIVDEEAAAVVQKIFSLCASGKGPTQIAKGHDTHLCAIII